MPVTRNAVQLINRRPESKPPSELAELIRSCADSIPNQTRAYEMMGRHEVFVANTLIGFEGKPADLVVCNINLPEHVIGVTKVDITGSEIANSTNGFRCVATVSFYTEKNRADSGITSAAYYAREKSVH